MRISDWSSDVCSSDLQKANSGFLLLIAVGSNSGRTGALELGNFANARVVDELRRVPGVGNVQVFASPYAMRIWRDPQKLANYRPSAAGALAAVQEQDSTRPGGQNGESRRTT